MTAFVAAIDFGTTYSGWAFSFPHEFAINPTICSSKNWSGGNLVSSKGPTCILIKPDGKTIHSFGYDAEDKYAELAEDEEHASWYYFRRFKMKLFSPEGVQRTFMLEGESGNQLAAKTVFSLSIKYLKDDLLAISGSRIAGQFKDSDISYVLTVPAIWNDAAKQFMREAAQDAGIASDKLTIALEPEAASLYCRHLPVEKCGKGGLSLASFGPGKRYIVLDVGGGTVDITVHEVLPGGQLKELHKASGGAWGGTHVDNAYLKFLSEIAGHAVITKFKEQHMEDYIDMLRDFEVKKRTAGPDKDSKVTFRFPVTLMNLVAEMRGRTLEACVKLTKHAEKVKVLHDKIRVDQCVVKIFFETCINCILIHVKALLRESTCTNIDAIVMVGGFSDSLLLQDAIRKSFRNMKVIVPNDAGLAVLKGAVIYGHTPTTIVSRVSKFTYGTDVCRLFDPAKHPIERRLMQPDGSARCKGEFATLVKHDQTLEVGKAQDEEIFHTLHENQSSMGMDIYAAEDKIPVYVDDDGCKKIGTFLIPVSGFGIGRKVAVKLIFGGTEILVECVDVAAGTTTSLKVDFLS